MEREKTEVLYLRACVIVAMLSISKSTLQRMEKAGEFPQRRRISKGTVGWLKSEVEEWVRMRESRPYFQKESA